MDSEEQQRDTTSHDAQLVDMVKHKLRFKITVKSKAPESPESKPAETQPKEKEEHPAQQ